MPRKRRRVVHAVRPCDDSQTATRAPTKRRRVARAIRLCDDLQTATRAPTKRRRVVRAVRLCDDSQTAARAPTKRRRVARAIRLCDDEWLNILSFVGDEHDLAQTAGVSKQLHELSKHPRVWNFVTVSTDDDFLQYLSHVPVQHVEIDSVYELPPFKHALTSITYSWSGTDHDPCLCDELDTIFPVPMPSLKSIRLCCHDEDDLRQLNVKFPNLEHLLIPPNELDLTVLNDFPHLTSLTLCANSALPVFQASHRLEQLTKITKLHVQCHHFEGLVLSTVSQMKQLVELGILLYHRDEIDVNAAIAALKTLPHLQHVVVYAPSPVSFYDEFATLGIKVTLVKETRDYERPITMGNVQTKTGFLDPGCSVM